MPLNIQQNRAPDESLEGRSFGYVLEIIQGITTDSTSDSPIREDIEAMRETASMASDLGYDIHHAIIDKLPSGTLGEADLSSELSTRLSSDLFSIRSGEEYGSSDSNLMMHVSIHEALHHILESLDIVGQKNRTLDIVEGATELLANNLVPLHRTYDIYSSEVTFVQNKLYAMDESSSSILDAVRSRNRHRITAIFDSLEEMNQAA